jgi:hypothetical protein
VLQTVLKQCVQKCAVYSVERCYGPLPTKNKLHPKLFSGCRHEVFEDGKIWRHIYSFMLHASCQEHKMTPFLLHSLKDSKCSMLVILLSKLICCIISFGWFPGDWILCSFVSEDRISSIFTGGVNRTPPIKMKQCSETSTHKIQTPRESLKRKNTTFRT